MADPNDPNEPSDWSFSGIAESLLSSKFLDPNEWMKNLKAAGAAAGNEFKDVAFETADLTTYIVKAYGYAAEAMIPTAVELGATYGKALAESAQAAAMDKAIRPMIENLQYAANQHTEFINITRKDIVELSGLNVNMLEKTEFGVNTITARAVKSLLDTSREVSRRQYELLDGTTAMMADLASPDQLFERYAETILKETRLFKAASEGINEGATANTELAIRRLGISAESIRQLSEQELSATGKITGAFLDEQMKVILATAEATGANIPILRKNLEAMTDNFKTFGAMSRFEMASLSNTVVDLGLSISDVTTLASKFSSFDSAIQTVNNLTAATGATLDTMRLFELSASGDIEEFVYELRGQLEDAGVEFENMNKIQQNALASSFGLEPEILQRVLSDNIDVVGSTADVITNAAGKLSEEEMQRRLLGMQDILGPKDVEEARARSAKIEQFNMETAKTVGSVNAEIRNSINAMYETAFGKITASGQNAVAWSKTAQAALTGYKKASDELRSDPWFGKPLPPALGSPTATPASPAATPPVVTQPIASPPTAAPNAANSTVPATSATANQVNNQPLSIRLLIETASDILRVSHINSGVSTPDGRQVYLATTTTNTNP